MHSATMLESVKHLVLNFNITLTEKKEYFQNLLNMYLKIIISLN